MNLLPDPEPGKLWLVATPRDGGNLMLDLVARLVPKTPLRLVDGGNSFDAYRCSRAVAQARTAGQSLNELLERIQIARAFTCYQMLTLLEEMPAGRSPVLALDILATFYDESVSALEATRLLEGCTVHLHRLSRQAPVVVSIRPPHLHPQSSERLALSEILQAAAHRVWNIEISPGPDPQLPLFPPWQNPDT